MSGSWELRRGTSVLVDILHVEHVTFKWSVGLRRLRWPGPFQDPIGITGVPFDHGRNLAAMKCLESGSEWLFFLDSDVVPPPNAIEKLISHGQPIMSGLYHRRSPPVGLPVMQRPHGVWLTKYKKGSVVEVDVVGAGCLLIHRSVLEQMKPQRPLAGKHWFDWRVDAQSVQEHNGAPMSEDFTFCLHGRQTMGLKILVDTSIRCRHLGFGESDEGIFEPIDHNRKVE